MNKINKKILRVLYIAPVNIFKTGVADYALEFKKCMEHNHFDLKISFENPFRPKVHYSIFDLFGIYKEVCSLNQEYDLIHAEMSSSSYLEFWYLYFYMKKFPNIPIVLTIHDSPYLCLNPFHIFFFKNYRKLLPFRIFRKILDILIGYRLEREIVRKTKFIFVTTKGGLKKFKRRLKIDYVDYIPYLSFEQNSKCQNTKSNYLIIILFFGFIRKGKGVDILIDAFYRLLLYNTELRRKAKLILCGGYNEKDSYFQKIRKKIKILNLSKNVEITGYLKNEHILAHLKEATCVVLPYFSKSTYSSSGALIRALEVGSAVIVSNTPMLTEFIKDGYNGLVFKEGDTIDLYSKLLILIENEELRKKFSKNSIDYIYNFHNNKLISKKVIQKYMEILNL